MTIAVNIGYRPVYRYRHNRARLGQMQRRATEVKGLREAEALVGLTRIGALYFGGQSPARFRNPISPERRLTDTKPRTSS
jgi:hypothetical protein